MNYYYNLSEEVAKDIDLANALSNEEFERYFNLDAEDREVFIMELKEDFEELYHNEEMAEKEYESHYIDDWREPYTNQRLYY